MLLQDESSIVRRYLNRPFARSAFGAQRIYLAFNSDVLFKVVDFRHSETFLDRPFDRNAVEARRTDVASNSNVFEIVDFRHFPQLNTKGCVM